MGLKAKSFLIILGILILAGAGWWYFENRVPPVPRIGADVIVETPVADSVISQAPLVIQGKARGTWFFEASFPAMLVDSNGVELGLGIMQAKSDWMTNEFVAFEGEIYFDLPQTENVFLVLKKDNPSGLPGYDKSVSIPLKSGVSPRTVQVFFTNDKLDPEITCEKVFPVVREIPYTLQTAHYALLELLRGPSGEEAIQGYGTALNPETDLLDIIIKNGVAQAVFNESLDQGVGGSCWVSLIRKQIDSTLKQFETVKEV